MTELTELRGKEEEMNVRYNLNLLGIKMNKPFFSTTSSVYIPTSDKHLREIDALFISESGILVVECKHMTGDVIGGPRDRLWTKTGDGRVLSFLNPIQQNHKHIDAVASYFHVSPSNCLSVIIFNDDCNISGVTTGFSAIVMKTEDIDTILPKFLNNPVFSKEQLSSIISAAKKLNSGKKEEEKHLADIREEKQRRRSEKKRDR